MPSPQLQPLDLSLYVTAPRLSVPVAVALAIALLSATPKSATQAVRRAAVRMRGTVLELQQEWRRHVAAGLGSLVTPRRADSRVDRAFRAMSMRIEALTLLDAEASPDVEVATLAHERLFPEGLRFLALPYPQQWAHCDRLLATLGDDETLAADVERLVGDTVLTEVRAAQEAYGEALGITAARESVETISLVGPLDAVRNAIVGYAVQIIAMQSDDPARLPAARKALAPIDELRASQAAQARRSDDGDASSPASAPTPSLDAEGAAVTPDTPVPTVDDEPTPEA